MTNQDPKPIVVPDEYSAFVQQMLLQRIWLASAHIENRAGPEPPVTGEMTVQGQVEWHPIPGGFRVMHRFTVSVMHLEQTVLIVNPVYGMDYTSALPMTNELFEPLKVTTFILAIWPYLREFVASVFARMNWPAAPLPTLVVHPNAMPQSEDQKRSSQLKTIRRRRPRAPKQ